MDNLSQPSEGDDVLPPGLSFTPPSPANAPPPQQHEDDSVLPPGLSFSPPSTGPKDAPQQNPPIETGAGAEEVPGLFDTLKQSYTRALSKQLVAEGQGLQAVSGAKSPEQMYQEAIRTPEQKDAIDRLNDMPLAQGWSSTPWWMQKIGSNLGALTPGLGYAVGASAATTPVGGVAAFATEAAIGNLVPSYIAARKSGLDENKALDRAIIDSGLASSFAVAMGLAGKLPITNLVRGEIGGIIRRPVAEAFAQFGLVQPALMAGQDVATSLAHGQGLPSWGDLGTDVVVGTVAGLGIHEVFKGIDRIAEMRAERTKIAPPASEAEIAAAAEAQRPKKIGEGEEEEGPRGEIEPAAPGAPLQQQQDYTPDIPQPAYDRDPVSREPQPIWYSRVGAIIRDKMPENSSVEQVMGILRNSQVPREMLDRSYVPQFLENQNGTVNKGDLLAHIEANSIQIQEVETTDQPGARRLGLVPLEHDQPYNWLPGPQTGRRELIMYVNDPIDVRAKQMAEEELGPGGYNDRTRSKYEARAIDEFNRKGGIPDVARDPHWGGIPNPFVAVRNEERRGPTGQRTLVNVENQSLHQIGAKEGYKGEQFRSQDEVWKDLSPATQLRNNILKKYKIPSYADITSEQRAAMTKGERRALNDYQALRNEFRKAGESERRVPISLPFKSDWQELGILRNFRYAVDHGFDELGFINGDMAALRLGTREESQGAHLNYDHKIPATVKKWAKYYGMDIDYRRLDDVTPEAAAKNFPSMTPAQRMEQYKGMGLLNHPFNQNILIVKLNQRASQMIRQGLQYDKDLDPKAPRSVPGRTLSDVFQNNPQWKALIPHAKKIDQFINKVAAELGVTRGIEFQARSFDEPWRGRMLDDINPATGNYVIEVNLQRILTPHDLYASMSHEFGHVIWDNLYKSAPDNEKASVKKAFQDHLAKIPPDQATVGQVRRLRDNMVSLTTGARAAHDGLRISDLVPKSKDYFLGQKEWFAEQVAKYMTTDAKPLGLADSFFKRLANKLRKMFTEFVKKFPGEGTADKAIKDFLDKRWSTRPDIYEPIEEQFDMDTQKKNSDAQDREGVPDSKAVPQEASTGPGREIIKKLPPSERGLGEAMAAHGDRMNWFFKLMLSLPQVAKLNPGNRPLAYYADDHRMANILKNQIGSAAEQRVMQWRGLNAKDMENLTGFIDAYSRADFKLPHTQDGIFRRPTNEEFAALVRKYGLSGQAVNLFRGIQGDFDGFLNRYRDLLVADANKIKDPVRRMNSLTNINTRIDKHLNEPFMPLTRYGKYLITVRAKDGSIRWSEQTNSLKRQEQIREALEKSPDRLPGDEVLKGMVPKDATPFLGMPPGLLNLIQDKLALSPAQRGVLDQLRFDYAPGHSFKHQFKELDRVPGYSTDFMRNYAHFFFHGANHLARIQYGDHMRDMINLLRTDEERYARVGNTYGANKLDQIVQYMQKHYDAWLDPKSDWAQLRGLMFHVYLGFSPATALNNLTQTMFMTHPYLASVFGDFASAKAIFKASTDISNFYKKGTILAAAPKKGEPNTPENFLARARAEATSRGTISETQAHQLAAVSEDRNLMSRFGTKAEAAWLKFQEASSWMFDASEQYNRRVAFDAALNLAFQNPGHKEVVRSRLAEPLLYKDLLDKGWTPQEAGAFVTASQAVENTQFAYSPWARPALMRGPWGSTVFVFKLFTQNVLFNLASNPAMAWRSLLTMAALGGMMGLPGSDNLNSFIKTLAWRAFGKDFDLEREARQTVHDITHGVIDPDLVMHGLSAKGFGMPAVMHSVGANWFPTVDMSRSIGMGNILPADPFKPFGPVLDREHEELKQLQNAMGAAFGLPLSIYDFSTANDNFTDLKQYEKWMPRFLGNLSHAFRYAYEGAETSKAGNPVVKFNVRDTEQMMEILARAGGFQPRRLTEEWARIGAQAEVSAYWQLRKQGLMRQFAEAVRTNSQEDKDRVVEAIKKYNRELPDFAQGQAITDKGLLASVQQRMRASAMIEAGFPTKKSDIPIAQELEKYYPRGWPQDLVGAKQVQ